MVVGDGPERPALERLAGELGVRGRVEFRGALAPDEALEAARAGAVFVLPSVDEAFGVAYVEAMAGGVPAIGCRGEPGPEEIARGRRRHAARAAGRPGSARGRAPHPARRRRLAARARRAARATVERAFTWEGCGRATVAAYEEALR